MRTAALIAIFLMTFYCYSQDTIVTKNDRTFIGKIKSQDSEKIYFKTNKGYDVEINKNKIVTISINKKAEENNSNNTATIEDTLNYLLNKHYELAKNINLSGKYLDKSNKDLIVATSLSLAGSALIIIGTTMGSGGFNDYVRPVLYTAGGTFGIGAIYKYFSAKNNYIRAIKHLKVSDNSIFK